MYPDPSVETPSVHMRDRQVKCHYRGRREDEADYDSNVLLGYLPVF
jgi:hypothetical protein